MKRKDASVRALIRFATEMEKLTPAEQRANVIWLYDKYIDAPIRDKARQERAKVEAILAERKAEAEAREARTRALNAAMQNDPTRTLQGAVDV